ncbi:ATP-dependent DNA helicase [Candidatus Desantisbacteria bacterium CG1_02_49_89]|nr:MAG: ATP-dependent DNA helicase [Candidatus Desantisbacteria bacterium CG1_02_49_89]
MQLKESENVEFKKSTSELKEAVIAISAILNKHAKGKVYFGIKNDGTVVGQEIGGKTIRDISQAVSSNVEPRIYPKIAAEKINGKRCAVIEFEGTEIPYLAFGKAYMRVSDENKQLSARELEKMFLAKNKDKLNWDTLVCEKAKYSHISSKKLRSFLKIAGLKYDDIKSSLQKLGLCSDGKIRNAAVMLFARDPRQFFPNAKLRCAVFATNDTAIPVDMQDYEGDPFFLIEKAQEYILKNIHIGMKLDGLRRIDVPEIDREAFREAVINAFCHRDYREYDSVNIAIFKNRLEIRNPGLLYGGLTITDIKTKMVSEEPSAPFWLADPCVKPRRGYRDNTSTRRNELIAELFHRVHFIEKWGRGINLILSREPDADFREIGTHFIVTFKRKGKGEEGLLKKTVEKILALIKADPGIIQNEIMQKAKLTRRGVEWNLKKLKEKGLLRRIGPDKGGHWEVIEK